MDDIMKINEYMSLVRKVMYINGLDYSSKKERILYPHFYLGNGVKLSVQAGSWLYSKPKANIGLQDTYSEVEVCVLKLNGRELPDYLDELEGADSIIAYCPVDLIDRYIEESGGIQFRAFVGNVDTDRF